MRSLSKKDIRELNEQIGKEVFSKKELVQEEDGKYYCDKQLKFFTVDKKIIPSLKLLLDDLYLPRLTVDMGAVKFVVKGADMMRPGITRIDPDLEEGAIVAIVDETHGKPIAVGQILLNSVDLMAQTGGKVVKNIHFIGDELWNK